MNLAAFQQEFMAHVLEEGRPLPNGWGPSMAAGLAIYRNAYRARLVDALAETFPRTSQWLGQEAFAAAAAHHLIGRPPRHWTLDMAGEGFVETLAELFHSDPDVPDLAWLEWAMHLAFTAGDCAPLDTAGFSAATAGFDESDWANMDLSLVPSTCLRRVRSDCVALWQALQRDEAPAGATILDAPLHCLVWREGMVPAFMLVSETEADSIASIDDGASFGDICARLAECHPADKAAASAGTMLSQWLSRGLIAQVIPNCAVKA